jgi:phosphoesterase RecJ-like protein
MPHGLSRAAKLIKKAKTIAVSGHINPDGDSIGSMLGLGLGLASIGKSVQMVCEGDVPQRYRTLPGSGDIVTRARAPIDLAIAVDCGSREMLGRTYDAFLRASDILEIDHHGFRRPFGTASYIDRDAAAVGEMVFALLRRLDAGFDKAIAQNIMTSIVVETNSFRLPNVRPGTFDICARLIRRYGVDFHKLVETVFWSMRSQADTLSGVCLSRSRFSKGGRLVWSIVRLEDFRKARGRDEDVDPVPDDMRSIDGVMVAVLFREQADGRLRVSLRSKGKINVASVAESYGGGGHFDVAGCTIENDKRSVREFLRKAGCLIG